MRTKISTFIELIAIVLIPTIFWAIVLASHQKYSQERKSGEVTQNTNYQNEWVLIWWKILLEWVSLWGATPAMMWCDWTDILISTWWLNITLAWCNLASDTWLHKPRIRTNTTMNWNHEEHYYQRQSAIWTIWQEGIDPCPAWRRLPTKDEWRNIIPLFKWSYTTDWIWAPFNLPLAGREYDDDLHNQDIFWLYWSSSEYDENSVRTLYFSETIANFSAFFKDFGLSVRCIK